MQLFERALRRANLAVAHTQGFNPRPRLVFALALPLGIESLDEIVDVDLLDPLSEHDVLERLGSQFPEGLALLSCTRMAAPGNPVVAACAYRLTIPAEYADSIRSGLERLALSDEPVLTRERKGRARTIHLKQVVRSPNLDAQELSFELVHTAEGGIKPSEFLEWLGIDPNELRIVKTRTILAGENLDPSQSPHPVS